MFQSLIDEEFEKNPNAKGILMYVEAPDQNVSWGGMAINSGVSTGQVIAPGSPALIASITKTYVAGAILRLVEQGKFGLQDAIESLVSAKSSSLLTGGGYDLQKITVAHLLSNTSCIFDYVNAPKFQDRTTSTPSYEWTRDEQIELAISEGKPLGEAGDQFSYSDTNFLLLTEIIEKQTEKPFFEAMRQLLRYEEFGLDSTWFALVEDDPEHLQARFRQFATGYKVNSQELHATFDLFGGGGIVSTTKDLAVFTQNLFAGHIFEDPKTAELLYTKVETKDKKQNNYFMGIAEVEVAGKRAFGHGGFWGTMVKYMPSLNCTIAVFLLERDEWPLTLALMEEVVKILETPKN